MGCSMCKGAKPVEYSNDKFDHKAATTGINQRITHDDLTYRSNNKSKDYQGVQVAESKSQQQLKANTPQLSGDSYTNTNDYNRKQNSKQSNYISTNQSNEQKTQSPQVPQQQNLQRLDSSSDWDKYSADMEPKDNQEIKDTVEDDQDIADSDLMTKLRQEQEQFRETDKLRVDKVNGIMFVNQYIIVKYLGRGACGKVFLTLNVLDKHLYAMKVVQKDITKQSTNGQKVKKRNIMEDMKREINIMKQMRHSNIVSLREVINDPLGSKILLVMEYMPGGCILTRQSLERKEKLPEQMARRCFKDMVKALDYLHFNKIVHGDLKPENVLVAADGIVKLSDFGCSKIFVTGNEYLERCNGTPAFLAPEMMKPKQRYRGRPTDVYALGACLYTFIFGRIPFTAPNLYKLFQVVQNEPVRYPSDMPISEELRDLLDKLLVKNPKERVSLQDIMDHPWVTDNGLQAPIIPYREIAKKLHGSQIDTFDQDQAFSSNSNGNGGNYDSDDCSDKISRETFQQGLSRVSSNIKQFDAGEVLWKQKEIGSFMLYVIQGQCEVLMKFNQKNQQRQKQQQQNRQEMQQNKNGSEKGQMERQENDESMADEYVDEEDLVFRQLLVDASQRAKKQSGLLQRGPEEFLINTRGKGEFIGEMAFFANVNVRCATVKAVSPMTVCVISRDQLLSYLQSNPQAKHHLKEIVWSRESELIQIEALYKLSQVSDSLVTQHDQYRNKYIQRMQVENAD